MRVFSAGVDVTDQVGSIWFFPAAQERPIRGSLTTSGPVERYADNRSTPVSRTADGAVIVPANMGCKFFIQNTLQDLTAVFVFDYPQQVVVEALGSETFTFQSYIGPGFAGRIGSLAGQMGDRYGNRHDKFTLDIPDGADFLWLNYPPTPVSAYASPTSTLDHNIRLPSSGTYRLIGEGDTKSVDHLVSSAAGNIWTARIPSKSSPRPNTSCRRACPTTRACRAADAATNCWIASTIPARR
jgi:hypothetical protein